MRARARTHAIFRWAEGAAGGMMARSCSPSQAPIRKRQREGLCLPFRLCPFLSLAWPRFTNRPGPYLPSPSDGQLWNRRRVPSRSLPPYASSTRMSFKIKTLPKRDTHPCIADARASATICHRSEEDGPGEKLETHGPLLLFFFFFFLPSFLPSSSLLLGPGREGPGCPHNEGPGGWRIFPPRAICISRARSSCVRCSRMS